MGLTERMVEFFTATDKHVDINKDVDGKGTHERFNEIIGEYVDEDVYPLLDNLMKNLYDPANNFDRFIPLLEGMVGFHYDKQLIYFDRSVYWRRRLLQGALHRYAIKGTKKGYVVLFRMLGLEADITYNVVSSTFDSPGTFDEATQTFDMSSLGASGYVIHLSGTQSYVDIEQAVLNIIEFNEPINAVLAGIAYNNQTVQELGDFNLDFNTDF